MSNTYDRWNLVLPAELVTEIKKADIKKMSEKDLSKLAAKLKPHVEEFAKGIQQIYHEMAEGDYFDTGADMYFAEEFYAVLEEFYAIIKSIKNKSISNVKLLAPVSQKIAKLLSFPSHLAVQTYELDPKMSDFDLVCIVKKNILKVNAHRDMMEVLRPLMRTDIVVRHEKTDSTELGENVVGMIFEIIREAAKYFKRVDARDEAIKCLEIYRDLSAQIKPISNGYEEPSILAALRLIDNEVLGRVDLFKSYERLG